MTNQINDRGLRECPKCGCPDMEEDWNALSQGRSEYQTVYLECKAKCGISWSFTYDDAIEGHCIKGEWDLSIWKQAWNTRHQPANQEDCRASFEKWWRNNTDAPSNYSWLVWQAGYQSRPAVVGDDRKFYLIGERDNSVPPKTWCGKNEEGYFKLNVWPNEYIESGKQYKEIQIYSIATESSERA